MNNNTFNPLLNNNTTSNVAKQLSQEVVSVTVEAVRKAHMRYMNNCVSVPRYLTKIYNEKEYFKRFGSLLNSNRIVAEDDLEWLAVEDLGI